MNKTSPRIHMQKNLEEGVPTPNHEPVLDRSRKWSSQHKLTSRLQGYLESLSSISCLGEVLHQEDQMFLSNMEDPICFLSTQLDTMYYDQAMAVHDSNKFRKAMIKEIATHFKCKHLTSIWASRSKGGKITQ